MATETKSSTVKLKSSAPDGSSKGKIDSSAVKKKVQSSTKLPTDSKMKSVSTVTKSEVPISLRNWEFWKLELLCCLIVWAILDIWVMLLDWNQGFKLRLRLCYVHWYCGKLKANAAMWPQLRLWMLENHWHWS